MPVRTQFDIEKAELETVLASEVFAKSPNLAKMLQYIGLKYLAGQEQLLKEYNIGVEALGRPPEFDPREDSIVRVEAHRLREKLKRYYETEGANHSVTISMHVGRYVPQFLRRNEASGNAAPPQIPDNILEAPGFGGNGETTQGLVQSLVAANADSALAPTSGAVRDVTGIGWRRHMKTMWMITALFVFLGSLAVMTFRRSGLEKAADSPTVASKTLTPPPKLEGEEIRIISGYSKKEYIDRDGRTWGPDRYYSGGGTRVGPEIFIARAADPRLFQTSRDGEFTYDIPLKPGTYELRLYFVETEYGPWTLRGGGEVSRLFEVELNGNHVLFNFDVFSDAGGSNIADERIFKDVSPAPDGFLHLRFIKTIDYPILNALEIVPTVKGKMQPIRLVAQEHSYTDDSGRLWIPDRYSFGGRLIAHAQQVTGTPDPGLYAEERYGHFDYAIPVAEGHYGLTLRFAETYFGPANPGKGGVGNRLFDVYCNGVALLRNFDVFKEAGGENRALDKTFHNIEPNGLGKLIVSFVPVRNYASVKAIEVVDESK
jgi:hypothetical protein